ncbi:MAG: CRISPR system Cmr subunit Cmr5 [Firmicutes bacterium]|nr:CRISPR system Cmr subunit Cmr5 [Bacillota bacterium]
MMLTRNQRYAAQIFEQVSQFREAPETERKKYGSMAHKLPVLIHTAGLAQALAFVDSRGSAEQKKLLDHIAAVVNEPDLLARSRTAELNDYMRLTHEVLAALVWYKRFVQSVLGIEAGEEAEGGGNE